MASDTIASVRKWLLRRPSSDSGARLFCFPYSGVGASVFAGWPRWIDGAEVCLVQPPGRENRLREAHFGTYEELADSFVDAVGFALDRPFAFFGHCAGALPAFEVARVLAARGLRMPDRMFVSSQVAPHDCPFDRFLELNDAELTAELTELIESLGGRPDPAQLELTLSVLHQDLQATGAYSLPSAARLATAITVLNWTGDDELSVGQMSGWRDYSADVRFADLPGGHYDFLSAPESLLMAIRQDWADQFAPSDAR
jgi:surfactin synthase thioesterase subunit